MTDKTDLQKVQAAAEAVENNTEYFKKQSQVSKFKMRDAHSLYTRLPKRYKAFDLDGIEVTPGNKQALEAVRNLDVRNGKNLLIHGTAGNGKTRLAIGGLIYHLINTKVDEREIYGNFCSVGFVSITQYFVDSRAKNGGDKSIHLPNLLGPSLLVIDDLGKVKPTDYVYQEVFAFLDKRYSEGRSTIFTTNFEPESLMNKLSPYQEPDEALYSRISSGKVIEVTGKDRR